jgi:hypothetical protein
LGFFYFYSTNESQARAAHFYPHIAGLPEVIIDLRENQEPLDQFIGLLFEVLNSRGEPQFSKLCEEAEDGSVSKENFAKGILKLEFEAAKATRHLLAPLKFKKKEINSSHFYKPSLECPNDFDGFLAYLKRRRGTRDVVKEYEAKYDELRRMAETSSTGAGVEKPYAQQLAELRGMGLVDRAQHDFSIAFPNATIDNWVIGYFIGTNLVWCDVQYHEPRGSEKQEQEFGYLLKDATNWSLVWQVRRNQGEGVLTNR